MAASYFCTDLGLMSYEMRNVITFLLGRKKYAEYNKYYEIVWVGPCKNAMSTSKSTNYWVTGSQNPFSKKKKIGLIHEAKKEEHV
jgi:hypothetical protein